MQNILVIATSLCIAFCGFHAMTAQTLKRIEPPFWWTDMHNPELQIMAYGEGIANTRVTIDGPAAVLTAVHKLENANYLFIDLELAPGTKAANVPIHFSKASGERITHSYKLRQREAGSAQRPGFTNADVMYLITPDRFANGDPSNDEIEGLLEGLNRAEDYGRHGGDLEGIRQHLDYIKDVGFTAIWLNPVLINDQDQWSYHGYATTDYYQVDPRFGTNQEYEQLAREARGMGIKMIMDIIVNHCGSFHWWTEDPPSKDWIHYTDQPYRQTNHLKTTLIDPYVAKSDREGMVKGWFVPAMPDLNQENPFMSTYLIQNSIWWIEYAHLAGIRQDTYSYPYRQFMTDWTCAILDEYPHFNIVGEEWVESVPVVAYWQRGKNNEDGYTSCLPSLMDFPMTANLHKALNEEESWGQGLRRLYEGLAYDYLYADPYNLVIFPDNHDMSRIFTQVNEDYDLFKMALSYILTMRGVPQLFYGTEILMANPNSESHGEIRSDFPGGWAGDEVNVFEGKNMTERQQETLDFTKLLLHWRKDNSAIHTGKLTHFAPDNGVYVYFRYDHDHKVMVVLNKNVEPTPLDMSRFLESLGDSSTGRDVTTGAEYALKGITKIPARCALVLDIID